MADDKSNVQPEVSETSTHQAGPQTSFAPVPQDQGNTPTGYVEPGQPEHFSASDEPPAWFKQWQDAQTVSGHAPQATQEPASVQTPPRAPRKDVKLTKTLSQNEETVPDWYRENGDLVSRVNHLVHNDWRFMSAGQEGYIAVHSEGEFHRAKTVAMLVDGIAELEANRPTTTSTDVNELLGIGLDAGTAEALGIS